VAHVLLAPAAERDLRALRRSSDLDRIQEALTSLERTDAGLDVRPLEGRSPWRRLREGDWRVLFRPLSAAEVREHGLKGRAYLVARIVNRKDLLRATKGL
jgi:hypothetical protein